jgi:hypothetical protein
VALRWDKLLADSGLRLLSGGALLLPVSILLPPGLRYIEIAPACIGRFAVNALTEELADIQQRLPLSDENV